MSNARAVLWVIRIWLLVALVIGASGQLASIRPPLPVLVLFALTVVALASALLVPRFRDWADSVDLRVLVGFHIVRFVGIYFIVLYQRGQLPYAFAVPGGIGDIVVAAAAALLLASKLTPSSSRMYFWWNLLGLADILIVVATAGRLAMADPDSMGAMMRLPLSLLPTWLVPLIITSHVLIFRRLLQRPSRPAAALAIGATDETLSHPS